MSSYKPGSLKISIDNFTNNSRKRGILVSYAIVIAAILAVGLPNND
jgi:hypothetical protein